MRLKNWIAVLAIVCVFTSTFVMFSSFVVACENEGPGDCCHCNPTVYNQHGTPINPLGGAGLTINGSEYTDMQIDIPISIKNRNLQGMTVTLRPYGGLRDYIEDANVYLQAGETKPINLRTWVGGHSYRGAIEVYYTFDDGATQLIFPIVNTEIIGQNIEPPPASTCDSHYLDGCYGGMKRDYYCSNGNLTYSEICTEACCQDLGGKESICSDDRKMCLTFNTLPPGTEGNIAFVCKDANCNTGNEKSVMFMLRLQSWNVTAKQKEAWTETDISNYDIIACTDESKACALSFNSLLYNQHTNERKPFLEIPYSKSVIAAYNFGYTSSKKTTSEKQVPFVNSTDYLLDGYSGSMSLVRNAENYMAISKSYLNQESKALLDSKNGQSSVMFKVKEAEDHGRYAYIGWMYSSSYLTTDGKELLNRTLKWLKGGDAAFGGTNYEPARKGSIAVLCQKDGCSNDDEMNIIKYLRKANYSVVGKKAEAWSASNFNSYDLIVCTDSDTCNIGYGSAAYNSYKYNGLSFLEIPNNGQAEAAAIFGYIHSKYYKSYGFGIAPQGTELLFSGYSGYMELMNGKSNIYGPSSLDLNPATTVAKAPGTNISSMFVYDASGSRGRYAYVGWVPDMEQLTVNGDKLLSRVVDWLVCGSECLTSFSSTFGDLSFNFDITSPTNTTYATTRVYVNVAANQRVKEMSYSINGGKPSRLCKDCSSVSKRISARKGANKIAVTVTDYLGSKYEKAVYFFVKV
jgi:protein-tyrosine-phosphatase